jgi:hypothetical protein
MLRQGQIPTVSQRRSHAASSSLLACGVCSAEYGAGDGGVNFAPTETNGWRLCLLVVNRWKEHQEEDGERPTLPNIGTPLPPKSAGPPRFAALECARVPASETL